VKKTKPALHRRYSFGKLINRNALSNKEFLNALNESEKQLIEKTKSYLDICLFVSVFL